MQEKNVTREMRKSRLGNDDDPEEKTRYLFRVEFLVHSVGGMRLERLNQISKEPTKLIFKFFDFNDDKIEVSQVDENFNVISSFLDVEENFSSGCSVLFAISTYFLTKKLVELIINVTVLKENCPEIVGKAVLDMTDQFLQIRKEFTDFENFEEIPSKTFEGKIPLIYKNAIVGDVDLVVRMSICGRSVMTEIEEIPEKSGIFMFKPVPAQTNSRLAQNESYQCRIVDYETGPVSQVAEMYGNSPSGSKNPGNEARFPNEEMGIIQSSRGPKDWRGKPVVISVSETFGDADGEKPAFSVSAQPQPAGPQQDVFILRFGKKGIAAEDEKSNIEIHLKTPRGADKRGPVRWESRQVQTEDTGKEKKEKAKKKKKKKKKK